MILISRGPRIDGAMDDANDRVPPSAEEVRRQQLRHVRHGCGCVCLFLFVIGALGALGPLLRWLSVPAGAETVAIANFNELAGALLWTCFATVAFLLTAISFDIRSRGGAAAAVALALVAGAGYVYKSVFSRFVALGAHNGELTLSFAWPRPAVRIAADDITEAEIVDAVGDGTEIGGPVYRLELATAEARWVSATTLHRDRLERALGLTRAAPPAR